MNHGNSNPGVLYCVAGGVAIGIGVGMIVARTLWGRKASADSSESDIWNETYPEGGAQGFTVRKCPSVDLMLEKWEAGSSEPPHSHPGDDMTIVVEGKMSLQFFKGTPLVKDGPRVVLCAGDIGYVKANRVHDAKYHEHCKLVYVHNKTFGFQEATV